MVVVAAPSRFPTLIVRAVTIQVVAIAVLVTVLAAVAA